MKDVRPSGRGRTRWAVAPPPLLIRFVVAGVSRLRIQSIVAVEQLSLFSDCRLRDCCYWMKYFIGVVTLGVHEKERNSPLTQALVLFGTLIFLFWIFFITSTIAAEDFWRFFAVPCLSQLGQLPFGERTVRQKLLAPRAMGEFLRVVFILILAFPTPRASRRTHLQGVARLRHASAKMLPISKHSIAQTTPPL